MANGDLQRGNAWYTVSFYSHEHKAGMYGYVQIPKGSEAQADPDELHETLLQAMAEQLEIIDPAQVDLVSAFKGRLSEQTGAAEG